MPYLMFQYEPTDTRNWNEYNGKVGGWIDQLLAAPGAVSFVAYRTADGVSPNTMTLLEFGTAEEARKATASEPLTAVLQGLKSLGITSKVLLVERSPFTPEPIRVRAERQA